MLSGEPSAAAASDDERSSVVTDIEVAGWNTVGDRLHAEEHQEEHADYEVENSPTSSEDSHPPTEDGGTTDAVLEEVVAYAEGNGMAATDINDTDLGNIIARNRSRGAHSDPLIPAPPTDAFHASPAAEDAEREK